MVKGQSYPNWELCIADDASDDPELLQFLKGIGDNQKIKVIFREKNGHISAASNTALEVATGQFVTFLDHDDLLHKHALSAVASYLVGKKKK